MGGVAAVGSGLAAGAAHLGPATVMTRNLYLGADLERLRRAEPGVPFEATVDAVYRDALRSRFDRRASAIADEVAATRPDLVGLQEVATLADTRGGSRTVTDYLRVLAGELEARGLSYDPVASVVNASVSSDAAGADGPYRVSVVDHDVILAMEDVPVRDPRSGNYAVSSAPGVFERGYCSVDVAGRFAFVNTHLEPVGRPLVQRAQASELTYRLDDGPAVLVGDLNSGPADPPALAYGVLTGAGGFTDAVAATVVTAGQVDTCCQAPDLRNEASSLTRRIDHVLVRGGVEPASAELVGEEPDDRIGGLWPSDHAGVVVTVEPAG